MMSWSSFWSGMLECGVVFAGVCVVCNLGCAISRFRRSVPSVIFVNIVSTNSKQIINMVNIPLCSNDSRY